MNLLGLLLELLSLAPTLIEDVDAVVHSIGSGPGGVTKLANISNGIDKLVKDVAPAVQTKIDTLTPAPNDSGAGGQPVSGGG